MGGTTITIQEDTLFEAVKKLIDTVRECESIPLSLDSITIMLKDKATGEYLINGNMEIELSVGLNYAENKIEKNIVIFAHFGK